MKTYILRDPKTVEPQTAPRRLRAQPGPPPPGPTLFIGLDVHNDAIAVSLSPSDSTEVRRHGILGGQHDDLLKVLKKLPAAHPGVGLKLCYEAGLRGGRSSGRRARNVSSWHRPRWLASRMPG